MPLSHTNALVRRPASAIKEIFTFSFPVFETGLKSFKFQFKLLILNFKFALLKLNFVGVLNSCVYQRKSCLGTISFLIDDRDVLSESLLCVSELFLESIKLLILNYIRNRFLLSELSSKRLNHSYELSFDT